MKQAGRLTSVNRPAVSRENQKLRKFHLLRGNTNEAFVT